MSRNTDAKEIAARAGNGHPTRGPWKYEVDGRRFESDEPVLSGAQIKARAGVDPSAGLFLEGHGHGSDRPIGDGDQVDFRTPGHESFYSMPPATFGTVAIGPTHRSVRL